jgi:uncharacterized membrane protein YphA (DoxX/SURF4 family)
MNRTTKILLVLLRIVIGWHFLYEGVFKIESDHLRQQYLTSHYYLRTANADLHEAVSSASTAKEAVAAIDEWRDGVVSYFKSRRRPLDPEQIERLDAVALRLKRRATIALPAGERRARLDLGGPYFGGGGAGAGRSVAPFDWHFIHEEVLRLSAGQSGARPFTAEPFLRGSRGPFRHLFRGFVADAEGLDRLTAHWAVERLDRRYEAILNHYRRSGYPLAGDQEEQLSGVRDEMRLSIAATLEDPVLLVRLKDYQTLLARVGRTGPPRTPFERERLEEDRRRLDEMGAALVAFVEEPVAELSFQAQQIVTVDQMRAGPPPNPAGQTALIDSVVKWGLAALGLCLMLGLFTPAAALGAAAFLAFFYLASPPWPGLPAPAGDGHYLFIDRNLIEFVACLVLVSIPVGRWAGLDSWLARWALPRKPQIGV